MRIKYMSDVSIKCKMIVKIKNINMEEINEKIA